MSLFGFGKDKKEDSDAKKKKDPKEVGDETINCSMEKLQQRLAQMTDKSDNKKADDKKKK